MIHVPSPAIFDKWSYQEQKQKTNCLTAKIKHFQKEAPRLLYGMHLIDMKYYQMKEIKMLVFDSRFVLFDVAILSSEGKKEKDMHQTRASANFKVMESSRRLARPQTLVGMECCLSPHPGQSMGILPYFVVYSYVRTVLLIEMMTTHTISS